MFLYMILYKYYFRLGNHRDRDLVTGIISGGNPSAYLVNNNRLNISTPRRFGNSQNALPPTPIVSNLRGNNPVGAREDVRIGVQQRLFLI